MDDEKEKTSEFAKRFHSVEKGVQTELETFEGIFLKPEKEKEDGVYELEGRIGIINEKGSFQPGVTKQHFDRLLRFLSNAGPKTITEWTKSVDYYYYLDGKPVRTRVGFTPSSFSSPSSNSSSSFGFIPASSSTSTTEIKEKNKNQSL